MRVSVVALPAAALLCLLASCGGGGDSDDPKPAPATFTITSNGLPTGVENVPYSFALATSGGTAPVTFDWNTGFTPPGWLNLATDGTLSGTPQPGTFSLEFMATDSSATPNVATKDLTLVVQPAPQITKSSLARAVAGQAYSETLTHNAPAGMTVTFAIGTGALPAGVTMTPNGAISGLPAAGGLHVIRFNLVLNAAVVASRELDLVVYEALPFTYVEDANEPNDILNQMNPTMLLPTATPPGRISHTTRHIQSVPLTVSSNVNIPKPDPSDFFQFSTPHIGTITIDLYYRYFVGEVDAYLWHYKGFPTHEVAMVAKSTGIQVNDERIVYHNALLSNGVPGGFYYLEVQAPGDNAPTFWNHNGYTFKVSFNDLTIVSDVVEADSIAGAPVDVPLAALNAGMPLTTPSWSLISGNLPPGVVITNSGRVAGTPSQYGLFEAEVEVRDGALSVRKKIYVRFYDSVAGNFWQNKGERRLFNGMTNPILETFGDAIVVAPHPLYPTEGAIYVIGGRTETATLNSIRVFNTDRAGIPLDKQFMLEDLGKPMAVPLRYHGAAFVQHSYGGYIYVIGGEVGAPVGVHSAGEFYYGVRRLQVSDGTGLALAHPLASNWENVADLPTDEAGKAIKGWAEFGLAVNDAAADADDRIYLVGGCYLIEDNAGGGVYNPRYHNIVLMYECATAVAQPGTWHRKADNPYQPRRLPSVGYINGRIYIAGGREAPVGTIGTGGNPVADIQMIQPNPVGTNASLASAPAANFPQLTEATYYALHATMGGALYVWAGWDAAPQGTRRLHRFTPNAMGTGGTVTRLRDTDWGTGFGAGVAHDGKLWTISGFAHGVESKPVNLRYTP